MESLRRRWPIVLILLAPLLALWKCVLRGEAVGPFDQIRQMAPWNGPRPDQPWDVLQADGVIQFYVWRDLVLGSWGQGVLPAWNPFALAGTPLLANSQSGALYSPHILLGLLHVPTGTAMALLAWFHLAWAGLGTYALVRRLGGNAVGAWLGGVLFALSPFMLAWAALPSVITTVAWIPWILANIAALFRDESRRGASVGLAASVAMLLLAGHLQFAAYGLMAAALMVLALSFARANDEKPAEYRAGYRLGTVVRVGLLLGLGAMLAAPQLVPVLRYSEFSHRRGAPTSEGYEAYVASALKPTDVVSRLANPFSQGDPTKFVTPDAPFSTFWPLYSRRMPYAESAVTIGPVCLVLLGLLAIRRPTGRSWGPVAVVGVVALLLAIGTPINRFLYFFAPGWSSTGSPGRVICLFVLAACVLAGLAFPDEKVEDPKEAAKGIGLGALVALLSLVPFLDPAPQGFAEDAWAAISGAASQEGPVFLLEVLLGAVAVFAAVTRRIGGVPTMVAALTALAIVAHVPRLVRTGDPSFLAKSPVSAPAGARIAVINDNWEMFQAASALLPPNTAAAVRIHDLAGYDSLLHRETVAFLRDVNGVDPAPPANGNMMLVKPSADPQKLSDAGVTEVWSRRELPGMGAPIGTADGVIRYAIAGHGRAGTRTGGAAVIEGESLSHVEVRGVGPDRLVLRERNIPGWSVEVDGKAAELRGDRWLEVDLPAGEHRARFQYEPPGMRLGIAAAGIAAIFLAALSLMGRRKSG